MPDRLKYKLQLMFNHSAKSAVMSSNFRMI